MYMQIVSRDCLRMMTVSENVKVKDMFIHFYTEFANLVAYFRTISLI